MAGQFSLAYGGTTITLSPLARTSPRIGLDHGLVRNTMVDGTLRVHTNFVKQYFEFEVNNVSKSDADNINSWKQNAYTLVCTPDTDAPGTTYNVQIMNDDKALFWMPEHAADTLFQGIIMLRQV